MTGSFSGLVRNHDPETSWAAAERQTPTKRAEVAEILLRLFAEHGPMTDPEIEAAYMSYVADRPWMRPVTPQSLRTRRAELRVAALVRPTGESRPTRTGHQATVWALTDSGHADVPTDPTSSDPLASEWEPVVMPVAADHETPYLNYPERRPFLTWGPTLRGDGWTLTIPNDGSPDEYPLGGSPDAVDEVLPSARQRIREWFRLQECLRREADA